MKISNIIYYTAAIDTWEWHTNLYCPGQICCIRKQNSGITRYISLCVNGYIYIFIIMYMNWFVLTCRLADLVMWQAEPLLDWSGGGGGGVE